MKTQSVCHHCGGPVVIEDVGDHGYHTYPGILHEPTCTVYYMKPTYIRLVGKGWQVYEALQGFVEPTDQVPGEVMSSCPKCGGQLEQKEDYRAGLVLVCQKAHQWVEPVEGCPHCTENVGSAPGLHSMV